MEFKGQIFFFFILNDLEMCRFKTILPGTLLILYIDGKIFTLKNNHVAGSLYLLV